MAVKSKILQWEISRTEFMEINLGRLCKGKQDSDMNV